jgi:hypothetical protein
VLPSKATRGAFDLYDVDRENVVGQIGDEGTFPNPRHDNALSPDAEWHASGYMKKGEGYAYVIYRRSDGMCVHTRGFGTGGSGSTRIDPAPRWNRQSNALLVPGVDKYDTRQLYVIRIKELNDQ